MKKMILVAALVATGCAARVRMPPEVVERHRQEISALTLEGKTREAWEAYLDLVNTSGVPQYPDVLLEIATAILKQGAEAPKPAVRRQAVEALPYAADDFAFDVAAGRLTDDDLAVRAAAVDVLRKLGRPKAIELIRPQLKRPPAEERGVFLTEKLLARENLRMHAFLAVAALGDKSLPVAPGVRGMSSPDSDIRAVAARVLGEVGKPEALPSLRYGMEEDIEWHVNTASAEALLKLGRRRIVNRFAEEASGSEYAEKLLWAINMRRYHDLGPSTDWILNQGTYNGSAAVRARSAAFLGEMGVTEAKLRLTEMLDHFETIVEIAAAYALAMLRNRSKIDVIVEATGSQDPEARAKAVEYLAVLTGARYVDIFRRLQEDPEPHVRLAAILVFRPEPPGALADLAFRYLAWPLGDEDDKVRFTAAALIRSAWRTDTGE